MASIEKENLEKLLNKQKNVKIAIGSIGGVVLIFYFFTFAMLVDKAPPVFFVIETIIAIVIVISFFMLNRLSFRWIQLTKSKKEEFKDIIPRLSANDVDEKTEKVFQKITQSQ